MTDENSVTSIRMVNQKKRFASRWRGNLNQVETEDGELHVATTSSQMLAQHIAVLHNRTFGDGQDPPPGYTEGDPSALNEALRRHEPVVLSTSEEPPSVKANRALDAALNRTAQDYAEGVPGAGQCLAYLQREQPQVGVNWARRGFMAGYAARSAEVAATVNTMRTPERSMAEDAYRYARGHLPPTLRRVRESFAPTEHYLDTIRRTVDDEVRGRIALYAAREPAKLVIDNDPVMMANVLRLAGYEVTAPGDPQQEPPTVALLGLATTRQLLKELRARGETESSRLAQAADDLLGTGSEPGLSDETLNYATSDQAPRVELVRPRRGAGNGVMLFVNGEELAHLNDGDTGGAGLTLGVRALCEKLGLELSDFGKKP